MLRSISFNGARIKSQLFNLNLTLMTEQTKFKNNNNKTNKKTSFKDVTTQNI
jgi:hypothetical protein